MTPYYDRDGITIYHGRCEDILPMLPADSVDVVITDPPYSEHVHGKVRQGADLPDGISRSTNLGFDSISPELMRICAHEFSRLATRWVTIFCDVELSGEWMKEVVDAGLDYVRTGAWVKLDATPQFSGDRPAPGFETIVIAHPKGRKRWNGGGGHAVWSHRIVIGRDERTKRVHTTQKPEALMRQLVALFSEPGETILDAFIGSGTTLVAARDLGRRAIGIEKDELNCVKAVKRLQQSVMNFEAMA